MEHMLAGGSASLMAAVTLQPLDVIKTRLQEKSSNMLQSLTFWRQITHQYQNEGVASFWRGTIPTILRNSPGAAIYFSMLHWSDLSLRWLSQEFSMLHGVFYLHDSVNAFNPTKFNHFFRGFIVRCLTGYVFMPITVVKTRLESEAFRQVNLWRCVRDLYAGEGVRGFFRGFVPTILRDAPYSGLYLLFYQSFKRTLDRVCVVHHDVDDVDDAMNMGRPSGASLYVNMRNFGAGIGSGLLASLLTHPFDVIKTRMQLQPSRYATFFPSFRQVARDEPFSLLSGLGPRILRKASNAALTWTLYERLVHFYHGQTFVIE